MRDVLQSDELFDCKQVIYSAANINNPSKSYYVANINKKN